MKNNFFPVVFLIILFSSSCSLVPQNSGGSTGSSSGGSNPDPGKSSYRFPQPVTKLATRSDVTAMITGNVYYLDAVNGDDINGNGTKADPWQSIAKTKGVVKSGDGVFLADGNYGHFIETRDNKVNRNGYVIFINEEGAVPLFTHMNLNYTDVDNKIKNAYLLFYGLKIQVEAVDPAGDAEWQALHPGSTDPFYPDSNQETYKKTLDAVRILYADNIQFINCTIKGSPQNKNLTENAVYMNHTKNIKFESCDISGCQAVFQYNNSQFLDFFYNHLHDMCRSCFREGKKITDIQIEGNYIHNAEWDFSDPWVPRALNTDYHGSGIAIKDEKHTIRNNIIHNGWTTSGITTYGGEDNIPCSGAYNNILIENNLIYDIREITAVANFYWLGKNVFIKNNTFVGYIRNDASGVYRHYTALNMYSTGYENGSKMDGKGIYIYNNVFAGTVFFNENLWNTINEDNNIYWSVISNKTQYITNESLDSNSKIIVWDTSTNDPYFISSFFIVPPDLSLEHHTWQDFRLSASADAVNFGNAVCRPLNSLGSVDNNGFINIDGRARDDSHHCAGCYEK